MAVVHNVIIPDLFAVHFLVYNEHKKFWKLNLVDIALYFYMLNRLWNVAEIKMFTLKRRVLKLSNNLKELNEELLKNLIIGFSSIFILIISLSKTVVILHVYVCL